MIENIKIISTAEENNSVLPKHIAIIMDGNGRWAKKRGLARIAGHIEGSKTVRKIVEACAKQGIKALTLYTFSSENWKRPKEEVNELMALLAKGLKNETEHLVANNIKFNVIGRVENLGKTLCDEIARAREKTAKNTGMILTLALNYGSRQEITDAMRVIFGKIEKGEINLSAVTEELVEDFLYTSNLPAVEFIIRTSGEKRLSNFLLWQAAYSEFYFTETLWPDFGEKELLEALEEYAKRERRFGG
ncbi:undecaprenyl pyrophosphate synthase [Candidatus Omnitrophus magneticus]|uniref:Isoprenyl transferase n=1 Tax=Candidatus Omnitrophus magneticus TaxID=1609969 RepID=A0A0F0CM19_9BACT|nr:undecaprenyl pyrophosphate synthase [Candidatus Omnitrophus magneticus]